MTNITPESTGLSSTIYCTHRRAYMNYPHNEPRIKVDTDDSGDVPISISNDFKVLLKNANFKKSDEYKINKAIEFMSKHHDIFMKHWTGDIDDVVLGIALTLIHKQNLTDEEALEKARQF